MTDTAKVPRNAEGGRPGRRPLVDDDLADQLLGRCHRPAQVGEQCRGGVPGGDQGALGVVPVEPLVQAGADALGACPRIQACMAVSTPPGR